MHILLSGSALQRLRLVSGLVLFAFALSHFLNHAVGLVGLEAMEAVQAWRTAVTRSWLGSIVLIAALLIHVSLAILRIARRTTLAMPLWEIAQMASGLLIPLLLLPHIVATRIASSFFSVEDDYAYALLVIWPEHAFAQTTLLLLVWLHGCIGLHFWLRLWPGYKSWQPVLLAAAVAVPILGVAGFITAGRETIDSLTEPGEVALLHERVHFPGPEAAGQLAAIASLLTWAFLGLVALAFAVIALRRLAAALGRQIGITYFAGPTVRSAAGPTLLEISRRKGVPHVSFCGGRGRCSTCRVHVDQGITDLAPPGPLERRTLDRIGANQGVRLACQIRPVADLSVTRLVKPGTMRRLGALMSSAEAHGVERTLSIMFLDIRAFTKLTQSRLPYDVVFILNRLFEHLGDAIRREGGVIEKYLGDGLMAVFGRESGPATGARQAIRAARAIDLALDRANAEIAGVLGQPVRIGVGLHAGPVVLGEIGHPSGMAQDVIGETVNAASRLESLTKEERCQLIVSAAVLKLAGLSLEDFPSKRVTVRGLDQPLDVTLVEAGRLLPEVADAALRRAATGIPPQTADNKTLNRREL